MREVRTHRLTRPAETVSIDDSPDRILAEDIAADRDYPPFNRSVRDGFAVRAADMPGRVRRHRRSARGRAIRRRVVKPGEAVEIMTGAPLPEGADAVVMVEHCTRP